MQRIIGNLISGFAVKAAAAVAAVYVASTVATYVTNVFAQVNAALPM